MCKEIISLDNDSDFAIASLSLISIKLPIEPLILSVADVMLSVK